MNWKQKLKRKIVVRYFKDVMDSNSAKYLQYVGNPTQGIKELFEIERHRILDDLEDQLEQGNMSSNIVDPIFDFYTNLMIYDYSTLALALARDAYEKIKEFEAEGQLVNKDKLYFLFALLSINTNNTIASTAYWELTIKESNRINGQPNSIGSVITQMQSSLTSLLNPVTNRHDNNILISALSRYSFMTGYQTILNNMSDLSSLSFLSSGIRNVQVNTFFDNYQNQIDVTKMYGQELINNLCILNEAEFKSNAQIQLLITNPKKRMIGTMITELATINPAVHAILGRAGGPPNGLYTNPRFDCSSESSFNSNYPNLIGDLMSGALTEDEAKAYILYGLHQLRNNGVHDLNPGLVYYGSPDLFLKTIGLLFAAVSVINSL